VFITILLGSDKNAPFQEQIKSVFFLNGSWQNLQWHFRAGHVKTLILKLYYFFSQYWGSVPGPHTYKVSTLPPSYTLSLKFLISQ
jgi:hypothetical protein